MLLPPAHMAMLDAPRGSAPMLDNDFWLHNARAANTAAAEIAGACGDRLMNPVEANELFVRCTADEREALRQRGFGFYDWGADAARFAVQD